MVLEIWVFVLGLKLAAELLEFLVGLDTRNTSGASGAALSFLGQNLVCELG